jgi:tRNA U34 5-methylaminomethyl-2-thiouridine-forming methyltransferase MnmC
VHNQRAKLSWTDGRVPVSLDFDDPYFSLKNGWEEALYVFLGGNDLPARFFDGFHVAELGFGAGLNFLATMMEWRAAGSPGVLRFTSFEAFPMEPDDMDAALALFPEVANTGAEMMLALRRGGWVHDFGDVILEVIIGDARTTLPDWDGQADAWYLDGFSPAKNPELWSPQMMQCVADHTVSTGTAATYTSAGFVRRGLEDAGFDVTRAKGFGRKIHMIVAKMKAET